MPALRKTNFFGTIIWLGQVPDRDAALRSEPIGKVVAHFAGPEGEDHSGLTRLSCERVTSQYPLNTVIRNTRQFSIVSSEELTEIAGELDLETFNPEWCGASIVIEGLPDFSHIPPSSRLQAETGTTLTIDMQNRPCNLPAPVIDEDAPGRGRGFKAAAKGRRGVTAWVEREGELKIGDVLTLHVPDQRAWAPNG